MTVISGRLLEGELRMGCTIGRRVTNGMYYWKDSYEWDVLLEEEEL